MEDVPPPDYSALEELEIEEMRRELKMTQKGENTFSRLLCLWGLDEEPPFAYEGWWHMAVRNFEEGK